jgi:hypothetical protein
MNTETYNCIVCNKIYSTYKSLWTHRNKFHKTVQENEDEYECRTCNKVYKHNRTRIFHEKTCNNNNSTSILVLEIEKSKIDQETKRIELEALKLQIKLQGMKKINNTTFKAINKLLMDRSTINNNTTNNTQNINNNNHYHLQIMGLGNENVADTLTFQEKSTILDRRLCSLEKMVEIVHCGSHNLFKNIVITNLKDKFAYRYDQEKGYFITENKSDVLDILVENRMMDIEAIYDELSSANKIDVKTKQLIQTFLDKMDNEEVFVYDTVEYPNFKSYKMNNIKILLYNNQDKITKDIALLIGENKILQNQEPIINETV